MRFTQHGLPLLVAAAVAFGAGMAVGAHHQPPGQQVADRFTAAWARGDLAAMHGMLTADARRATPLEAFTATYRRAAATATLTTIRPGRARAPRDGSVAVPVDARTRIFGRIRRTLALPIAEEDGEARIAWAASLSSPAVTGSFAVRPA